MSENSITIDGEKFEVEDVQNYGGLPLLEVEGMEFYVAESAEAAGQEARDYWEAMAQDDPKEFTCIVGESCLVAWALGQYAGPGSTVVKSLEEWLDLWLDTPEEHFASYDSAACDIDEVSEDIVDELGFTPTVAYRHN